MLEFLPIFFYLSFEYFILVLEFEIISAARNSSSLTNVILSFHPMMFLSSCSLICIILYHFLPKANDIAQLTVNETWK